MTGLEFHAFIVASFACLQCNSRKASLKTRGRILEIILSFDATIIYQHTGLTPPLQKKSKINLIYQLELHDKQVIDLQL